jgi:hypothetical protein
MLEIRKGNPWIFWPSSICDTFPLDPANKKLNGKFSFTLDIDFTLLDDTECKKTIFSLLPMYSGYDCDKGCDIFLYNDGEKTHTKVLPNLVHPNKKTNIKFKYIYNKGIEFSVDNNIQVRVEMKNKTLGYSESPHIIFGAGNFPKNNFNLNYTDIDLHEFKLTVNDEILSHHTFEKFIHDKSFDLTENCNFIHKI